MIEKNIPVNDRTPYRGRGRARSSYPFMQMEVGDSVFYVDQNRDGPAFQSARKFAQRSGDRRFSYDVSPDGIRIWRVA